MLTRRKKSRLSDESANQMAKRIKLEPNEQSSSAEMSTIKTEGPTSGETSNCLFSLAIKSETEENSQSTASEGASAKSNGPSTSQYPNDLFESKPEPVLSYSPSLSASASNQRNVSPVPGPSNRDFSIHEIFDGNEMNNFELNEGLKEASESTDSPLERVENKHTGSIRSFCQVCRYSLKPGEHVSNHLAYHMMRDLNKPLLFCGLCDFKSHTMDRFFDHKDSHPNEKFHFFNNIDSWELAEVCDLAERCFRFPINVLHKLPRSWKYYGQIRDYIQKNEEHLRNIAKWQRDTSLHNSEALHLTSRMQKAILDAGNPENLPTQTCSLCNWPIIYRQGEEVLAHFCKHYVDRFSTRRYICKYCPSKYINIRLAKAHATQCHSDKKDAVVDNIVNWDPRNVEGLSEECFGSSHAIYAFFPAHYNKYLGEDEDDEGDGQSECSEESRLTEESADMMIDELKQVVKQEQNIELLNSSLPSTSSKPPRIYPPRVRVQQTGKGKLRIKCGMCMGRKHKEKPRTLRFLNYDHVLMHFAYHLQMEHGIGRYHCDICSYETAFEIRIRCHMRVSHDTKDRFTDQYANWNMEKVRDISTRCFFDPDVIFTFMLEINKQQVAKKLNEKVSEAPPAAISYNNLLVAIVKNEIQENEEQKEEMLEKGVVKPEETKKEPVDVEDA